MTIYYFARFYERNIKGYNRANQILVTPLLAYGSAQYKPHPIHAYTKQCGFVEILGKFLF